MEHYGRLGRHGSSESIPSVSEFAPTDHKPPSPPSRGNRSRRVILLGAFAAIFLAAAVVTVAVVATSHRAAGSGGNSRGPSLPKPSQAISQTCSLTRYPSVCVTSFLNFPGATEAAQSELVHISVNMTLHRVGHALYDAGGIANLEMDAGVRSVYDTCMELLDSSVFHLRRSLAVVKKEDKGSTDDVLTWLSAALTNHDTCQDELESVPAGSVKDELTGRLADLNELISNSLAIYALSPGNNKDFEGVPVQNRRRLLGDPAHEVVDGFPKWLGREERRLLQAPASAIQADIVVAQDGSGTYKTIGEAVKAAPEQSSRRFVIHIKAGKYYENIKVARKKTNLMFIGDGKGQTVITSAKSVYDKLTTFHTATFASTGAGFIARDITFENTAGPWKHQAVALRIGGDHSVVYRCSIVGYQDSLYVHSQRQFYRECDVSGTVDFVFGNAAVVLQNCSLYARRPMDQQKCTITAQNRKDPNQNTGISIHNCRILAAGDLEPVKWKFHTYLGRPWKMYSRVVYMLSYMGDHVDPAGWLEWNGNFALDTLYYGEYMNDGPGAAVGKRVGWPGHRVITVPEEAGKFTVGQFLSGSSWLPSTGVAYITGLSS